MNLINIHFLSFTNRKFLLKTSCLLILILSAFFPRLQAKSITQSSAGKYDGQIHSDAEALVHEWLYNYYEKPTRPVIEMATEELTAMVEKFKHRKKRYSSEEQWLEDIFYQVHRKYLKRYQSFSTLPDLFERGTYDCVSGTALYALICELLYIPYAIRETEYHVYLMALVDGKKVLIESTDSMYGFVSQPDTVQNLIKIYHTDNVSKDMKWPANSSVDWVQLAGLQYFNKAVQYYNDKKFSSALSYLDKAMQYYSSARITTFRAHILQLTDSYANVRHGVL